MRNLKRVLTLVMAVAMLMSLMVVGAGATAFPDDKDIVNKDAVEKMVSLNIIQGDEKGNFNPTGIVTRAEMSKMIATALNGGVDPKLSSSSVVTASFSDTKGHWAEGYIEYCVNLGLVAGMGDDTFAPNQGVTGTQAAKMALVALGYDADFEKFVGTTWALNINKIAMQKEFYEGIQGIDPNAPITRDNVAQMLTNFCAAPMVRYEFGITGSTGGSVTGVKQAVDIPLTPNSHLFQTVLTKYYKLQDNNGVLIAVGYDSKKKEYSYAVDISDNGSIGSGDMTFYSATDYSDLIGMDIEVLWKDKTGAGYNRADDSVYDINSYNGSQIMATGTMDDLGDYKLDKDTLKFNGTTYDVAAMTNVGNLKGHYAYQSASTTTLELNQVATKLTAEVRVSSGAAIAAPFNIKLIDNNGDDKIDTFVVIPFTVQEVTYAGTDTTTFVGHAAISEGSVDTKNYTGFDGLAKDQFVAYYDASNTTMDKDTVVKMEVKTAKVDGVRTGEVLIGGTWYAVATGTNAPTLPRDGDTVDYVAFGSTLYNAKVSERGASSKNLLTVIFADWENDSYSGDYMKARVLLPNGDKANARIAKVDALKMTGAGDLDAVNYTNQKLHIGGMYTFKVNADNEYELETLVDGGNMAGHDSFHTANSGYNLANKTINGKELADNARVVIVDIAGKDAKVFTGKEIKNNGQAIISSASFSLVSKTDGFSYVQVATIVGTIPTTINKGSNYGYLLSAAYTAGDYLSYTFWDGTKEVTAKEKTANLPGPYTKGQMITFDNVEEGLIKNVSLCSTMGNPLTTAPITGWDGNKKIEFNGNFVSEVVKDDTTVIYIDSSNTKGVTQSSIQTAIKDANGNYTANAYYVGTTTALDLLVVDIKQAIPAQGTLNRTMTLDVTESVANIQAALNDPTTGTLTLTGGIFKPATAVTVPAHAKLVVDGAFVPTAAVTVNGNLVLNGGATLAGADATISVPATGSVKVTAGVVDNASKIMGTAVGATVTFMKDVSINASATLYYASTSAGAAAINGTVAATVLYTWTPVTGSVGTDGWVVTP